jgi:hypothetical protein
MCIWYIEFRSQPNFVFIFRPWYLEGYVVDALLSAHPLLDVVRC